MTAPHVVVAGEALIDLVPDGGALHPRPAGAPVNVAVGLGRLGVPTRFAGPLSSDGFGRRLVAHLTGAGVEVEAATTDRPTTLAVVHLDADGRASYAFYLAGTSALTLAPDVLPALPHRAALHVSFGAVGPTEDPAGNALAALIHREAGRRVVSLDPNLRPSAIGDRPRTAARVEELVRACDVVKVADADLTLLHPDEDPARVAARWATAGPALVVLTRGPSGAVGFGRGEPVEVGGAPVDVVDTIGAGDAFTAGLLAALGRDGPLDAVALRQLDGSATAGALRAATRVAALTCGRTGADPPTAADVAAASR